MHPTNKYYDTYMKNSFQEFGSQNNNNVSALVEIWWNKVFETELILQYLPSIDGGRRRAKSEITTKPKSHLHRFAKCKTRANFMQNIYWNMERAHSAQVNSKWMKAQIHNNPQFYFRKKRRILYYYCDICCSSFKMCCNQCWLHQM